MDHKFRTDLEHRAIIQEVMGMDVRLLQRIAYEVRCEERGLVPSNWKLFAKDPTSL